MSALTSASSTDWRAGPVASSGPRCTRRAPVLGSARGPVHDPQPPAGAQRFCPRGGQRVCEVTLGDGLADLKAGLLQSGRARRQAGSGSASGSASSRPGAHPPDRGAPNSMPSPAVSGSRATRHSSAVASACRTDRGNSGSRTRNSATCPGISATQAPAAGERLVRAARLQQHLPAELNRRGGHPGQQQPRRHVHPFHVLAEHQEAPGVVVTHRRVRQPEEQRRSLPDELQVDMGSEALGGLALPRQRQWPSRSGTPTSRRRSPRARCARRDRAARTAPAIALGLVRVVGELVERGSDVQPGGIGRPGCPSTASSAPHPASSSAWGSSSMRCT